MKRLAGSATLAVTLLVGLTGCQSAITADRLEPAQAKTVYYHDQLGNSHNDSDNDIETYDRWRQLFGS